MSSLKQHAAQAVCAAGLAITTLIAPTSTLAAPVISRLNPPSALFTYNDPSGPYTARFLPDQRFDLQVTVQPDADQTITDAEFFVDGRRVNKPVALAAATVSGVPSNTVVMTIRAYANDNPGVHTIYVRAKQSDGQYATARGNFEIVRIHNANSGKDDDDKGGNNGGRRRAKNIIYLIGDAWASPIAPPRA